MEASLENKVSKTILLLLFSSSVMSDFVTAGLWQARLPVLRYHLEFAQKIHLH